jgi:hypothetical protein
MCLTVSFESPDNKNAKPEIGVLIRIGNRDRIVPTDTKPLNLKNISKAAQEGPF